jgi:hypothetical protein
MVFVRDEVPSAPSRDESVDSRPPPSLPLPSIEYLCARKDCSPSFIDAIIAYRQIFDSAQTLHPKRFLFANLRRAFIDYLRFGLPAMEHVSN